MIMVGEIRDGETLGPRSCITAGTSSVRPFTQQRGGHYRAARRMGLERYCSHRACSGSSRSGWSARSAGRVGPRYPPPPALRAMFRGGEHQTFFRGAGCHDCRGSGFRGRIGIFELLKITDEMANSSSNAHQTPGCWTRTPDWNDHASRGMPCARCHGETTLEEVLRVTRRELTLTGGADDRIIRSVCASTPSSVGQLSRTRFQRRFPRRRNRERYAMLTAIRADGLGICAASQLRVVQ